MKRRYKAPLRTKKCRNRECAREFAPATEWQKYCSPKCRSLVTNRRSYEFVKKGRRLLRKLQKETRRKQQMPPVVEQVTTEQGVVP